MSRLVHSEHVKVVTFVPTLHAERVRAAMADAGAGHIGAYTACAFMTGGIAHFTPSSDANPTIGTAGVHETVNEVRIETTCPRSHAHAIREAILHVHPYEHPGIEVYEMLEFAD